MELIQIVKCEDRQCCPTPRSSYFKLLKQFLPAPICLTQNDGLLISDNSDEINEFTSLFLRLALDDSNLKVGGINEVPFDICCPSLKDLISARTCDLCGIYHATKKSLVVHRSMCKKSHTTKPAVQPAPADNTRLVRPQRLAARRQKEKMVVWTSRLNDEHCDWFDENEIDFDQEFETQPGENVMPLIHLDDYMQNVWENDE